MLAGCTNRSTIRLTELIKWPSHVDNGVEELLCREYPGLKIGKLPGVALERAFMECDFLLHGSGPSIVSEQEMCTQVTIFII